jgi:hypothetical protein
MKRLILLALFSASRAFAGVVTVIGFAGGSSDTSPGAIFVTSQNTNIDLGTRLYVGCFNDLAQLNATITSYKNGTATYAQTFADLTSNFVNFGTGGNYGFINQSGTLMPNQFTFNNNRSLLINGNSGLYNVSYGSISSVSYSVSVGNGRDIFMWTAFNDEIALVRNLDGIGATFWTTPYNDVAGIILNTSGINSESEVLIGNYVPPQTGAIGFIKTAASIPEPSSLSLLALGGVLVAVSRRKRA